MDWAQVQAFLAVAETGSLSAAARKLGMSQPTLGRHVRALEEDLQIELFRRQPRGLALTELGEALLPAAERMRDAATEITLTAAGTSQAVSGTVRITASVSVSNYLMPRVIAGLRLHEPNIQIELVANDAPDNLLFQEADIAIRMFRPEQQELVTKHIGGVALGLFASKTYLQRNGRPETVAQAMAMDLVGHDKDTRILKGMRERGIEIRRSDFPVRCDDIPTYWELIRAGCGLGFGLEMAASNDPSLERVLPDIPIDVLPVWLTAHGRVRHIPRIRRVWDYLSDALPPLLS